MSSLARRNGIAGKHFLNRVNCDPAGHFTTLMTAHTIGDCHQETRQFDAVAKIHRLQIADGNGVFVFWPAADIGRRGDANVELSLRGNSRRKLGYH